MSEKISVYDNVLFWMEQANNDPQFSRAMVLAFESAIGKKIIEDCKEDEKEEFFNRLKKAESAEDFLKLCKELGMTDRASISAIVGEANRIYYDGRRN
jgi:hypothetical protein